MSYTVIITEEIAANVAVTTTNYPITIEYNATNIASGSTYGNANVEALLDSGTMTTDIITTGAGDFGSIESGTTIVAAGNIVGSNIIANGQYLTNLAAGNVIGTVGLAQFVTQAAQANITSLGTLTGLSVNGAASATGNITGGNLITSGIVYTPQIEAAADLDLNTAGKVNVNGNLRVGDNNTDTQITTHGNGNLTLKTDNANSANIVVRYGTNANIDLVPHGTGQTNATGAVIATGNVQGSNIIGNGQYLTNLPAANVSGTVANAAYATTAGSATTATTATTANVALVAYSVNAANVSGTVANATYSDTSGTATTATTAGTVTSNAQGNITSVGTLAGLTATGNVNLGNVLINSNNIRSAVAWDASTSPNQGRITLGPGYDGDYSNTVDPLVSIRGAQFAAVAKQTIGNADVNQSLRGITAQLWADMGGATLTNNSRRMQGLGGALAIGNGTMTLTSTPYYPAVAGGGSGLQIGNITTGASSFFANTTTSISHGCAGLNNILVGGNATVGNAVASVSQIQFFSNNTGNLRTGIGNYLNFTGGSSGQPVPGNVYGVYMPGTTNNHGLTNSNFMRVADNYYFLRNEDDVAQNQLGSLRRYHEFNGVSGTTSGALTIDKNAGQVQQVNLAGNISSVSFSNFVSSASDSVNTDEQCDTVTIAFNQGATGGYGVTFPSGSTFKYAGNVRALQSTAANSVSLVSVSALRLSGTTTYLITISPGFVS